MVPVSRNRLVQDHLEYFSETSRRRIDLSQIEVFQATWTVEEWGKNMYLTSHDLTRKPGGKQQVGWLTIGWITRGIWDAITLGPERWGAGRWNHVAVDWRHEPSNSFRTSQQTERKKHPLHLCCWQLANTSRSWSMPNFQEQWQISRSISIIYSQNSNMFRAKMCWYLLTHIFSHRLSHIYIYTYMCIITYI